MTEASMPPLPTVYPKCGGKMYEPCGGTLLPFYDLENGRCTGIFWKCERCAKVVDASMNRFTSEERNVFKDKHKKGQKPFVHSAKRQNRSRISLLANSERRKMV